MSNSLITVIVPTYRKFEFLRDTVHSIYRQDYPRIEILITDDGSDNYNENIIQDLLSESPGHVSVRAIRHPQNLGTVKNLNYAVREAQGEFVCFLGSDDLFFDSSTIGTIIASFQRDTMVITGRMSFLNEDGTPYTGSSFSYPSPMFYRLPNGILYSYLLAWGNIYSAPGTVYRKSLFTGLAFYDENFKYLEDFPFWMFLLRKGVRIGHIPQKVVKYRLGGISTSSSDAFQHTMRREEYQAYFREYSGAAPSFAGDILRDLITLRIKAVFLPYDYEKLAAGRLKHPFLTRLYRKALSFIKRFTAIWERG